MKSLHCYGTGKTLAACEACTARKYCRDFARAEKALQISRSNVRGVPEWLAATPEPADAGREPDPALKILSFFLAMNEREFRILQEKFRNPYVSSSELARKCGVSRRKVYDFYKKITEKYPPLASVFYRTKKKKGKSTLC